MGYNNYLKIFLLIVGGFSFFLTMYTLSFGQTPKKSIPPNLADAFTAPVDVPSVQTGEEEIEPIVVGRKKWSDRPVENKTFSQPQNRPKNRISNSTNIQELEPLETKQGQVAPTNNLPMKVPSIPPAVNLHRNFEGKLVLKPRKFGIETAFPFQLENSRGKRLAFIDFQDIRSIDPISLKDKKVNILGKLEPVKEGSDNLVIRARILREIE